MQLAHVSYAHINLYVHSVSNHLTNERKKEVPRMTLHVSTNQKGDPAYWGNTYTNHHLWGSI